MIHLVELIYFSSLNANFITLCSLQFLLIKLYDFKPLDQYEINRRKIAQDFYSFMGPSIREPVQKLSLNNNCHDIG